MKWVARSNVKVDRVACPWLIRRFIDPQAEFLFVPEDQLLDTPRKEEATPLRRNPVSRSEAKPPGRALYDYVHHQLKEQE